MKNFFLVSLVSISAFSQTSNIFEPIDVFDLEYISNTEISSSGDKVLYQRNFNDIMTDESFSNIWLIDYDGTNNRQFVTEYQINTSNTWERKTITIPGDTSGTWNSNGLRIAWCLASAGNRQTSNVGFWFGDSTAYYGTTSQINFMNNTSYTFNLTGVQYEIGESATDFEHRNYAEELQLCKRYYQYISGEIVNIYSLLKGKIKICSFPLGETCNINNIAIKEKINCNMSLYFPFKPFEFFSLIFIIN